MIIEERKILNNQQPVFDIYERDSYGHKIFRRTIRANYAKVRMDDGTFRYIIYDEQMLPIRDIYKYLNVNCKHYADSSKENIVTALRLLVVFCAAHHLKDYVIPENLCHDFVNFLYRGDKNMNSTAALYFISVRQFLMKVSSKDNPILNTSLKRSRTMDSYGNERHLQHTEYAYQPKVKSGGSLVIPEHNTIREFQKLINVAAKHGDTAAVIIYSLMFVYGRRIGEVLALGVEDVSHSVDPETGEVISCLIHRKRLNAPRGKNPKYRYPVRSRETYTNKNYIQLSKHSYNTVWIPDAFHGLICKYILSAHEAAASGHPDRYADAEIDIVDPKAFASEWGLEKNHYVFLNSLGGPLEKEAWNKRSRLYHNEAGVPFGNGKSLNHAMRHGHAVIMRHKLGKGDSDVAASLGHRSLLSVDVYAKADNSTIADLHDAVARYVIDNIDIEDDEHRNDTDGSL